MRRTASVASRGMIFHILRRGVDRSRLFFDDQDYPASEQIAAARENNKLDLPPLLLSYPPPEYFE